MKNQAKDAKQDSKKSERIAREVREKQEEIKKAGDQPLPKRRIDLEDPAQPD